MRKTMWMAIAIMLVSTVARANEVTVPPCVMDLKYRRDGFNHDQEGRRPYLNTNQRLVDNLGDENNSVVVTSGFGKCHVKLTSACGAGKKLGSVVENGGFEWKKIGPTHPGVHYRATVTRIVCVAK